MNARNGRPRRADGATPVGDNVSLGQTARTKQPVQERMHQYQLVRTARLGQAQKQMARAPGGGAGPGRHSVPGGKSSSGGGGKGSCDGDAVKGPGNHLAGVCNVQERVNVSNGAAAQPC